MAEAGTLEEPVAAPADRAGEGGRQQQEGEGEGLFPPCPEGCSPAEALALAGLKATVEAKGVRLARVRGGDDRTLLRFLRARQLSESKALHMWVEFLRWRRANDVDDILQTWTYPEIYDVVRLWPQCWHKTDKEGRPVNIQHFGPQLDLNQLFTVTTEERLVRQAVWVCEELQEVKLPACSRAAGRPVTAVTVILNFSGVSMFGFTSGAVRRVLLMLMKLLSCNYPDTMGHLVIINAPPTFSVLWDYIRPLISPTTMDKISIHENDGLERLLQIIDAENLPSFLGGLCECEEGCAYAGRGPWCEQQPHSSGSASSGADGGN